MINFRHLAICVVLLYPLIGHSQSDTTYLDNNFKPTNYESAEYYMVIHREQDGRYKVVDHYMSNRTKMEGYYSDLKNEKREGYFTDYDKHGFKTSQGNFSKGKNVGKWEYFYDSSDKLRYTENFKDGKSEGELISYYKSGKIKRREQHNVADTTVIGVCYDENGSEISFTRFMKVAQPSYDFNRYLAENLHYPYQAREKNIYGHVLVQFYIAEDGNITDVHTVKTIGGGCDEEALRVIRKMPKWEPTIIDGKVEKFEFRLPITFRLE